MCVDGKHIAHIGEQKKYIAVWQQKKNEKWNVQKMYWRWLYVTTMAKTKKKGKVRAREKKVEEGFLMRFFQKEKEKKLLLVMVWQKKDAGGQE